MDCQTSQSRYVRYVLIYCDAFWKITLMTTHSLAVR